MAIEAGFLRLLADKGYSIMIEGGVRDCVTVLKGERTISYYDENRGDLIGCFWVLRKRFAKIFFEVQYCAQWEGALAILIKPYFKYGYRQVVLKKLGDGYTWAFYWESRGYHSGFSVWRKDCVEGFLAGLEVLRVIGSPIYDVRAF